MRGEKEEEGAIEERSRVYRYTYTYIYIHTRITRFLALAASFYAGAPAELLRGGAENELPWEVATRSTPPSCPASCVSPQPTSDIQGKTDHSPETGLVLLKHRPFPSFINPFPASSTFHALPSRREFPSARSEYYYPCPRATRTKQTPAAPLKVLLSHVRASHR